MGRFRPRLHYLFSWIMLGTIVILTGCTQAATTEISATATTVTNSAAAPATPLPTKAAEVPTATTAATSTEAAAGSITETPKAAQPTTPPPAQPTETAAPASQAGEKGFSAWCLPLNTAVSYAKDPLNPPEFAKKAKFSNGVLEIGNLPASGCVFLFRFDKTAPSSIKLEVSEINQPTPFLKVDLQPAASSTDTLWAFVQHGAIISPGKESSSFSLTLRDPLGQALQKAQLKLHSWVPGTPAPKEEDDNCGCDAPLPTPP